MSKVSSALIPVAVVILATLFYMEFSETNKRMTVEQGRISVDLFINVAWKYLIAFTLVVLSDEIIDSLVWINQVIGFVINKVMPKQADIAFVVPEIKGRLNIIQKGLINTMSGLAIMTNWLAEIVVKILIFLRFFQLFLYKGAAPIMVSTYISEEWRNIATGFIRRFIAVIIQGFLLVLILKVYPAIVVNDMFDLVAEGTFNENLAACFLAIMKSGVFIFVLVGSQNMAKQWMGV
jgi:hypothetical protein